MKILIACEESGTVREAFAAHGHDAWSCDLLPSRIPGQHIQGDALEAVRREKWDALIAFPDCTYLCSSGMHWTVRGLRDPQLTVNAIKFAEALWSSGIPKIALENPIGALSTKSILGNPSQIIQPWFFGDDASKKTCLWLKGFPRLEVYYPKCIPPTGWSRVMTAMDMLECEDCGEPYCPEHEMHYCDCLCIGPDEEDVTTKKIDGFIFGRRGEYIKPVWANQTPSGQNKLGPSEFRARDRSKTYQGIADAMAEQWGRHLK